MKKINNYILEKFKINSNNVYNPAKNLAELFDLNIDEAKYLYQFWDPKNELIKFNNPICSPLEGLLMLAFMLVDDDQHFKCWDILGTNGYKRLGGKNNPYDYSWFEEEDDEKGIDYLEALFEWISENENEFKKIYDIVKKHKNSFSDEKIFDEIQEVI